jgi:hypothetical protein
MSWYPPIRKSILQTLLDGADVAATDWVETSSDITNRALAIFKGGLLPNMRGD